MKRIGVLGGTFDPIHIGHLIIAESVRERARLDEIQFVPAGLPPHKAGKRITAGEHRYMMTVLATLTHPHFRVSRTDLDREGPSYTVDTLSRIKEEAGSAEVYFIMGSDSLARLGTWHQPQRLLAENHIIVATRPGWRLDEAKAALGPLYEAYQDRIEAVEVPQIGISSQEIRERAARGESFRYLVPDLVREYIESQGVYTAVDK